MRPKKSTAYLYKPNIIRVKLADILSRSVRDVEGRARKVPTLPRPGSPPYQCTINDGIIIQLVHNSDDTAALLLPQFHKGYWLTPLKQPGISSLYLRDSLNNRVRDLFVDVNTRTIGSRQELQQQGIYIYASRDLSPTERKARWERIFREQHPFTADTIINHPHNIALALKNRPKQPIIVGARKGWKHKRTWIAVCERVWWGYVRKGEAEKLQSQILATVTEHLRKRPSWMKRLPSANFWKHLHPLNQWRRIKSIEPPLPRRSW
jgi:hypothetical protein